MSHFPAHDRPMNRRGLLGAGSAAAAALMLSNRGAASADEELPDCEPVDPDENLTDEVGTNLPPSRLGCQLYSVSDQVGPRGWPAVLSALSEIGYRAVEFAGLAGADPAELKTMLADLDMRAVGQHEGMNTQSIQLAKDLGLPYTGITLITNIYGAHTDAWKRTADDFNAFGAQCAAEGIKFYVHMHPEPYTPVIDAPGKTALDILLAHTDPELVFFEMDLYWAYLSAYTIGVGQLFDPLDFVLPQPERFPLFHVKDGRRAVGAEAGGADVNLMAVGAYPLDGICDVGQGDIPFKEFFGELAKVSDLSNHELIWERDSASSHPHGSLASARASYLMMRHDHMAGPSAY